LGNQSQENPFLFACAATARPVGRHKHSAVPAGAVVRSAVARSGPSLNWPGSNWDNWCGVVAVGGTRALRLAISC
jgi:hypothetical protein